MAKSTAVSPPLGLRSFILVLVLVSSSFSFAMFQGGFVSWFLFYSILPAVLYAVLLLISPFSLSAERTVSARQLTIGDSLTMTTTLHRSNRFPLFYLSVAEKNALLADQPRQLMPGFRKSITYTHTIDHLPRGEYVFQGVRVKASDLFGFVQKEQVTAAPVQFMVYPDIESIPPRAFFGEHDSGRKRQTNSRFQQQDTSMPTGIRAYQPGDRMAWINWKATAKRNDFMTKEFEQQQSEEAVLFLDCSPSPHFETAVSFTASAIQSLLQSGIPVSLVTVSRERRAFPSRTGGSHLQQLLYHLAVIQDQSTQSFHHVIQHESRSVRQNSLLIMISAAWTDELARAVRLQAQHHSRMLVFLADGQAPPTASDLLAAPLQKGHFAEAVKEVFGR